MSCFNLSSGNFKIAWALYFQHKSVSRISSMFFFSLIKLQNSFSYLIYERIHVCPNVLALSSNRVLVHFICNVFVCLVECNAFDCKIVMQCLIGRYLIPCTHVMVSQRRNVSDLDLHCKSAERFLSLRPNCCRPELIEKKSTPIQEK